MNWGDTINQATYLLNMQRAIAQTDKPTMFCLLTDYVDSWTCAGEDLTYSLSLSENSCREHILHWLSQPDTVEEDDKGYYDRIVEINNLMEKM